MSNITYIYSFYLCPILFYFKFFYLEYTPQLYNAYWHFKVTLKIIYFIWAKNKIDNIGLIIRKLKTMVNIFFNSDDTINMYFQE